MPRVKLTSMLDDVKTSLDPASMEPVEEPSTPAPRPQLVPDLADEAEGSPAVLSPAPAGANAEPGRQSGMKAVRPRHERPSSEVAHVHYASLVRKEARLRDDQIQSLTDRARKLSRTKIGSDERITDNTLIRIAVDLLLARQGDLAGSSESELRKSVGL